MPVFLSNGPFGFRRFSTLPRVREAVETEFDRADANCIDLGLLNNMSDAALETTERQILKLLDSAAENLVVRLRLYSLSDFPRTDLGRRHLARLHYLTDDDLWTSDLDGLVITGTEPRAPDLVHEPYWRALTEVFDWADDNTRSTICSCLAVHAAVLHIDGIDRRALNDKCFGVFDFENVSNHNVMKGISANFQMPHSRWNEISEKDLSAHGYTIFSRSDHAGVDAFAKQKKSLFIFFQGHPEYEAWTLLSEYRRDIERFLRRERETYPTMPSGYLGETTVQIFKALRERALRDRSLDALEGLQISRLATGLADPWRSEATGIYRNWLSYLSAQKARRLEYANSVAGA
jgi:homoserine O-succinyltransferase/O-acetyltransferase